MSKPDLNREIGAAVNRMVDEGFIRPDRRRALPARASRRGAEDDRRAARDRQDRSRRAAGLSERRLPEEIQEPVLENLDRFITGVITVVPPLLVVLAGWQLWNRELHWRDIVIFLIMYIPIGLGVTVGFHRLLTHRSFKTSPGMRGLLAVLGTMSVEGPVISWVADHRKHHAYSDRLGDPHSPHVDTGGGWQGRCAASPTRTWGGCSTTPSADRASASRPTCWPTR
jgi:fatty acid desaturase